MGNHNECEALREQVRVLKHREMTLKQRLEYGRVHTISVDRICANPAQPRKRFEDEAIIRLAESLKQYGMLQPLSVRRIMDEKTMDGGLFQLVAGERRLRAAILIGMSHVPCLIINADSKKSAELAIIENIQRENLNPIDEARAYKKLLTEFHLKQDEVAERVSKSRTAVTNSMRLLKLDERVQQMVIDEMLTTGHARALISIEDRDLQFQMANQIFDNKLSVRETEKLVRKLGEEKEETTKTKEPDVEIIYRNLEEKVKEILGTKVQISHKKNNSGKIEIEYYSNEELERIIELLESVQNH